MEDVDADLCLCFRGGLRDAEPPDELRVRIADNGDKKVESSNGGESGSDVVDDVEEWESVGVSGSSAMMMMGW